MSRHATTSTCLGLLTRDGAGGRLQARLYAWSYMVPSKITLAGVGSAPAVSLWYNEHILAYIQVACTNNSSDLVLDFGFFGPRLLSVTTAAGHGARKIIKIDQAPEKCYGEMILSYTAETVTRVIECNTNAVNIPLVLFDTLERRARLTGSVSETALRLGDNLLWFRMGEICTERPDPLYFD